MQNELRHAEGWTKKNHKYIRKEGNRYIYPKEQTTESMGKRKPDWTNSGNYTDKHGRKHEYLSATYVNKNTYDPKERFVDKVIDDRDVKSREGRTNTSKSRIEQNQFRKLDETNRNRAAAANGKIVNPTYTLRDKDGTKIARLSSKDKIQSPTANDLKNYSREKSNSAKRKSAAGSPNEYVRNQEHAKKMTNIMNSPAIHPKYKDGIGPSPMSKQRGKLALRKQGSVDRQQESKDSINAAKRKAAAGNNNITTNTKESSVSAAQARNRREAANGNTIGKNGKIYTFRTNQDYAKRKSDKYLTDHAQNPDGSYGAREGEDLVWTSEKHTHSSKAAQKAGKEKQAYQKEVDKAVKATKDRLANNSKSKSSRIKDRVSKAISNLKNKKSKKKTVIS